MAEFRIGFETVDSFDIDFGTLHEIDSAGLEAYGGPYSIEPDYSRHVLGTKDKRMTADVTVEPIEVQRVSNAAGGRTVYIGGLIND